MSMAGRGTMSSEASRHVGVGYSRRTLLATLLALIWLMVCGHLAFLVVGQRSWQLERLFDLGREGTVPAWFSSLLLAASSLVAASCAGSTHDSRAARGWRALTLGLLFMSCDEITQLHEHASQILTRRIFHLTPAPTSPWSSWALVLGPLIGVAVGWLGRQLRGELRRFPATRRRLLLGAGLFFLGAAGLDLFDPLLRYAETLRWLHQVEIIVEETLEMVGAVLFLSGLLIHQHALRRNASGQPG